MRAARPIETVALRSPEKAPTCPRSGSDRDSLYDASRIMSSVIAEAVIAEAVKNALRTSCGAQLLPHNGYSETLMPEEDLSCVRN